eukprot:g5510.t1
MSRVPYFVDVEGNTRFSLLHSTSRSCLCAQLSPVHVLRSPIQTRVLPSRKPTRHSLSLSASANEDPAAQTTAQVALAEFPTFFERVASAMMYLLPLTEGLYRIALSALYLFKNQSLQFMFWFHHQHRQLTLMSKSPLTKEDILTLETLMQMSEKMHEWFGQWANQLVNLSGPMLMRHRENHFGFHWISMAISTPEAIWQIVCLIYMSILAALAAFRLTKKPKEPTILFRKPQIVSVSYFCALLMRMAWTPMEGMSDLSLDLYWLGASLLTALTTGCAVSQMHSLLFARMPKLAQFLESMAQEVTWIAQLHRSFLLLDWLLCLFSSESIESKCLRSLLLIVYWMTVTALEGAANSLKRWGVKA